MAKYKKYYKTDNRKTFYDNRMRKQDGKCAICKKCDRLVIDHNHETGMMRGLLCYKHNTALGLFGDNPDLLRAAAVYLEENGHAPYREVKTPTTIYQSYLLSEEMIPTLLENDTFPSDRARARFLAEKTGCLEATAQTRISRARRRLLNIK